MKRVLGQVWSRKLTEKLAGQDNGGMEISDFTVEQIEGWGVIRLRGRVDSFNFEQMTKRIQDAVEQIEGPVCIELTRVEFLSLPTIRFLNKMARGFYDRETRFSIVGVSDRTRRHIEIFGDLKFMDLYQEFSELLVERPAVAQIA